MMPPTMPSAVALAAARTPRISGPPQQNSIGTRASSHQAAERGRGSGAAEGAAAHGVRVSVPVS